MTHLPPATAGGTLRERFIADMTVRGFTEKTRKDHLRTVAVLGERARTSASSRSSSPSAA